MRAARVLAEPLLAAAGSATCFRDAQVVAPHVAHVIANTNAPGTEPAPIGTPVTVPVLSAGYLLAAVDMVLEETDTALGRYPGLVMTEVSALGVCAAENSRGKIFH